MRRRHLEGRNSPVKLLLTASGRVMSAPRVLGEGVVRVGEGLVMHYMAGGVDPGNPLHSRGWCDGLTEGMEFLRNSW